MGIQKMKFVKILFAFCQIESRSIFPKPRPTTLGFHPELPNLLIPVPLFTFGPGETEEQRTSTEIVPDPTTTNELTKTSSTAPPTASSAPTTSRISWTATIQNDVILTSTSPTPLTVEASSSSTTAATTLSDATDLSDRFFSAWDTAKEIGSIVLGGVTGIFSEIKSLFT